MSDARKRQPAGVPVGGQFSSNEHDEAAPLEHTDNEALVAFRESGGGAPEAAEWLEQHFERYGAGWDAIGGLPWQEREAALATLRDIAQTDEPGGTDDDPTFASSYRERHTQVRTIGTARDRDYPDMISVRIGQNEFQANRHELEAWGNAFLARAQQLRDDSDLSVHPSVARANEIASHYNSIGVRGERVPESDRRDLEKMHAELTAYCDEYPEPDNPSVYTAEQRQQWREDRTADERNALKRIERALGILDWMER